MELLQRFASRRSLVLLLLGLGIGRAWMRYGHIPKREFREWLNPPQPPAAADPAGKELLDAVETRERKRLIGRHRRISAKLEEARGQGFEVTGLQNKADAALKLNSKDLRRQAQRTLSEVEIAIPRKRVQYIPMYDAIPEPIAADAKAKKALDAENKSPKKKKKKRRSS